MQNLILSIYVKFYQNKLSLLSDHTRLANQISLNIIQEKTERAESRNIDEVNSSNSAILNKV